MTFDALFKQLFRDFFHGVKIQPNFSVGSLPLTIDLVIHPKPAGTHTYLNWMFSELLDHNLFEYKSDRDHPKAPDLAKGMEYLGLYANQQGITIEELTKKCSFWYVSVIRPKFISNLIENQQIIQTEVPGLYRLDIALPCNYNIVIID
jgi:hypothetical protein